ncbi:MAG: hypothetical protein NTW86_17255 [Candidatus Sumerlaeota bacterium]|nr:hypothetical protein [Candidatus Sumerlaeota bacterium]
MRGILVALCAGLVALCGCALWRPFHGGDHPISLDLTNAPVVKALDELKYTTGLNLAYSPELLNERLGPARTVTLQARSDDPEKLLQALAYAADLECEKLGDNLYAVRPKSEIIKMESAMEVPEALKMEERTKGGPAPPANPKAPASASRPNTAGFAGFELKNRPYSTTIRGPVGGKMVTLNLVFQKLDGRELMRLNEAMRQAAGDGQLTLDELLSFYGPGSTIQGEGLERHLANVLSAIEAALADGHIDQDEIENIQELGANPFGR